MSRGAYVMALLRLIGRLALNDALRDRQPLVRRRQILARRARALVQFDREITGRAYLP